jgi:hypothetical protein
MQKEDLHHLARALLLGAALPATFASEAKVSETGCVQCRVDVAFGNAIVHWLSDPGWDAMFLSDEPIMT